MKGESRTIVLGIVTALILVVNGLEAGSVLEPTTIDPSPPAAAAMIGAQHHESLTDVITMVRARRSTYAGKRGVLHDADSHNKGQTFTPRYDDGWLPTGTEYSR
jgi:hypothetical protein